MKKLILLLGIATLWGSCTKEKKETKATEPQQGDIVLVFKNMPENWVYHLDGGALTYKVNWGANSEVGYVDDNLLSHFLSPDSVRQSDTLCIKDAKNPIEIMHRYNGLEELSFIAFPKDTLRFAYEGRVPIVKSTRKGAKKHDYDYEAIVKKSISNNDFSGFTKHQADFFTLLDKEERMRVLKKGREEIKRVNDELDIKYKKVAEVEFAKETALLDSLVQNDLMSKNIADFYKKRIACRRKTIEIFHNDSLQVADIAQQDSLLQYSFYRDLLMEMAEQTIRGKLKPKKGRFVSATQVYDSIQQDASLTTGSRSYLSSLWIEKVIQDETNGKVREYFKTYKKNHAENTAFIHKMQKKYCLQDSVSTEIKLIDENGVKTTWEEVLNENKRKVLYVDFWASWCAPCKRMLPFSHKLSEKYQDVVFIYLGFNDSEASWKKALPKVGLAGHTHNYLITNPRDSKGVEDLKVKSIPRYLLYDKAGKLVNTNAPRPNEAEIETLFEKYLRG